MRPKLLPLLAGVALLLAGSAVPAAGTPVLGEASRTDTWLRADDLVSGRNFAMGYAQLPAAEYHDGGGPDAVVTTGRLPHGGTSALPWGLVTYTKTVEWHAIRALGIDGNVIPDGGSVDYWVKSCKDDPNDSTATCAHQTVTTDASGYFTASYGHTLGGTAVAVVASGSEPDGGTDIPTSIVVQSRGASEFTGRALNQAGFAIDNATIEIDLFATSDAVVDDAGYWHRAGEANVTTNSNGYTTLTFPDDFGFGQPVSSVQVTGATHFGSNIVGGPIAHSVNSDGIGLRLFSHDGDVIANTTVKVDYVASGPIGGSPRDPNVVPFSQWRNTASGFTGACGVSASDPCIRQSVGDLLRYRMHSSIANAPDVDGKPVSDWLTDAVNDWAGQDAKIPTLIPTTTPGDEAIINKAEDLGTAKCGDAVATWVADYHNGLNLILYGEVKHNVNPAVVHGGHPLDGGEECLLDVVGRHEYGHLFGIGHHPLGSPGVMAADYTGGGTVTQLDVQAAQALYGFSGSRYKNNLAISDFVRPTEGIAVGLVNVSKVQPARELPSEERRRFPEIVTPLSVVPAAWVGKVPETIEIAGGTVEERVQLSPETMPFEDMEPGSFFLVQIREEDGRVLEALPVDMGKGVVKFDRDFNARDDVDGGDPLTASLDRLQQVAQRRDAKPR